MLLDGWTLTNTMPTAAQTKRLTTIRVTIMATAGNGSFCTYGTRAWYREALVERFLSRDGPLAVPCSMSPDSC